MIVNILNYVFLGIALAGVCVNILGLYSSLKILKTNQKVYDHKLNVSFYKEPVNFRFFWVILILQILVWSYSSFTFNLNELSQFSKKLIWLNSEIIIVGFAFFSIFYFLFAGRLWVDPIKNHSKITFRAFAVVCSFALAAMVHFVVFIVEVKVF